MVFSTFNKVFVRTIEVLCARNPALQGPVRGGRTGALEPISYSNAVASGAKRARGKAGAWPVCAAPTTSAQRRHGPFWPCSLRVTAQKTVRRVAKPREGTALASFCALPTVFWAATRSAFEYEIGSSNPHENGQRKKSPPSAKDGGSGEDPCPPLRSLNQELQV
jgi:hypothetical protein